MNLRDAKNHVLDGGPGIFTGGGSFEGNLLEHVRRRTFPAVDTLKVVHNGAIRGDADCLLLLLWPLVVH